MTVGRFPFAQGAQSSVEATALPGVSREALGCRGTRPGPKLSLGPRVSTGAPGWFRGAGRGAAGARRLGGRAPGAEVADAEVPGPRVGGAAPGQRSRPRRPAGAPGRSHAGAPLTGRSWPPRAPLRARGAPASGGRGLELGGRGGRARRLARWARALGWEPSAGRAPPLRRPPGCLLGPDHHGVPCTGSLRPAGAGRVPGGAGSAASPPPSRITKDGERPEAPGSRLAWAMEGRARGTPHPFG